MLIPRIMVGDKQTVLRSGQGIVLTLCVVALAGALTGLADYCEPVVLMGFSLFILGMGGRLSGMPLRHLVSRLMATFGGTRKSGPAVN